jgi:hypothetical protein
MDVPISEGTSNVTIRTNALPQDHLLQNEWACQGEAEIDSSIRQESART